MAKEKTTKKNADKKAAAKSSTKTKSIKKPVAAVKTNAKKEVVETTVESQIAKASADVKKAVAASKQTDAGTPAGKLVKWHRWLGVLFLLQGLAVLLFGRNVTAPITMQYPSVDTLASEAVGHQVMGIASRHVADIHVEWVLATSLLVFAAVHLVLATTYRPYVAVSLKHGVNAFRWLSLGLGGGLLAVATGLISGISSATTLLVLFTAFAGGSLLALGAEAAVTNNNGVKTRFTHFLCGLASLGVLLPWIVFGLGVLGAVLWGGKAPVYLYTLYACGALLVGAYLLATHYRLKRQGKWADSYYAERGYLLLTLVTVTLLTWQIVAGALK